jgi:hypothetical protein
MEKTLFFILGSGRMGSTFLYRVLKEHPQVALSNEARVIDAMHIAYNAVVTPYGKESHLGFQGIIRDDVRSDFVPIFLEYGRRIILAYYEKRFGNSFTHFGEKLPGVASSAEMSKLWPDTRFIVLVRDPRDVASSYRSLQQVPDPSVLGERWEEFMRSTIEDFSTTWASTYGEILELVKEFLIIHYEDLMRDPDGTLCRILDHLGLDANARVGETIRMAGSPDGHGTSITVEDSIERWRRDLTEDEALRIMTICGPVMERLGLAITE